MKQFEYTINDPLGIHARPAGMLVKEANPFARGSAEMITLLLRRFPTSFHV